MESCVVFVVITFVEATPRASRRTDALCTPIAEMPRRLEVTASGAFAETNGDPIMPTAKNATTRAKSIASPAVKAVQPVGPDQANNNVVPYPSGRKLE